MIRFTTSMEECKVLWQKFSPHKRAWDEWDLMYAFHDAKTYTFNFMVHETDGEPDGLIPLVYDTADGSHELFGGCYPDSRILWLRIEDFPECFDALPDKTILFDLKGLFVEEILAAHPQYLPNFIEEDQQFFLVPSEFDYDFVNHINTFSKEKRKGFLYDLRKFRETNPELRWSTDDESELFFRLSVKNFGADSDHISEAGKEEVRRVVRELQRAGYLHTLTVSLGGEKQAVSMSALYGNSWIALYSSSNNDFNNLGKFLNTETIQEGCRLKVDEINYMTGMTWKKAWNMKTKTCRTMRKPAKPQIVTDASVQPSA